MIDFISSWTQGVIVAVIIATIIEMIIPEGSSKKYIKVVIGVYVLFNIVAPVINKVSNGSISLSNIMDIETYSKQMEKNNTIFQNISDDNTYNIKEIYTNNLKKDIKSKLDDKGYTVNSIKIQIENDEEYTIKSISLQISNKVNNDEEKSSNILQVEQINIRILNEETIQENDVDELSKNQKEEIKEYLSEIYNVKIENISINK